MGLCFLSSPIQIGGMRRQNEIQPGSLRIRMGAYFVYNISLRGRVPCSFEAHSPSIFLLVAFFIFCTSVWTDSPSASRLTEVLLLTDGFNVKYLFLSAREASH